MKALQVLAALLLVGPVLVLLGLCVLAGLPVMRQPWPESITFEECHR